MNIANVFSRFSELGSTGDEAFDRFRPLVQAACDYIDAHIAVQNPDAAQTERLELLAAAYALRLSDLCNADGVTSFQAGDVSIKTSSAGGTGQGERLWNALAAASADLLAPEGFLFGRIAP